MVDGGGRERAGAALGSPLVVDKEDGQEDEEEGDEVVPGELLVGEDGQHEGDEDAEGDDFLEDLELRDRHAALVAEAIGRDLEAVLEESDAPTGKDRQPERAVLEGVGLAV